MISELQKATAQAIVNVFETGRVHGDYGQVTVVSGDLGHLSYGRSQATLASGNLYLLLRAYCEDPEAAFARDLRPYLPRLEAKDLGLDHDRALHDLLRQAGGDPVMWQVQDAFFDRAFWQPAARHAGRVGVETPLGHCVVYDSIVHGSWGRIRDRTNERHGTCAELGEERWVACYVDLRRDWLANHSNRLLRRTVYRMDNLRRLIGDNGWALPLPLVVHGVRLDEDVLAGPAVHASAQEVEQRLLRLQRPFQQGDDVRRLQRALTDAGHPLDADGIFGPATHEAVLAFQRGQGLSADGIVGPVTWSALDAEPDA